MHCQKILHELMGKKCEVSELFIGRCVILNPFTQLLSLDFQLALLGPVDGEAMNLCDNYDIIATRVDLGRIKKKLENEEHANAHEFADDILLVSFVYHCYR